ncbi:MAG: hypothetical protein IJ757_06395 [Clostridiales bacterium]|nr:hypothetical protein [Clostridiales bacterium]
MLKKDLADKKGLNVILLLFMCFSSIITVCSAVVLYSNTAGKKAAYANVNAADVTIFSVRDLADTEGTQQQIEDWFMQRSDVTGCERSETIVLRANAVDFEPIDEEDFNTIVNSVYYACDLTDEHNKVTDPDGNLLALPYGTVAISEFIHRSAGINIGDKVRISTQMGNIYEFTVGSYTKDPGLNGTYRLFFNNEDYQVLRNDSPIITDVYMVDMLEGHTDIQEVNLLTDFTKMEDDFGEIVESFTLQGYNPSNDVAITTNVVMILMAMFLIIMVFMTISFTIKTAIKNEEKELGMLKALGVESVSFNWLFAAKYLAIAVAGTVVGFFGGLHISALYIKYVAYGQLKPSVEKMYLIALIASIASFVLIIAFVALSLRRMRKISIMDVIAGENRGERFGKLPGLFLHKIKNINIPFYLALTDVLTKIKRYAFLILAYVMGISLIIIMFEAYNTTQNVYWIENYWQYPRPDFTIHLPAGVYNRYVEMGGSTKGAYEVMNQQLEDAGIPAHIDHLQYVLDLTATHEGNDYVCQIQFDLPDRYEPIMYEGVPAVLPNEMIIDAYHAQLYGIEIGDTVSIEYYKYNDDRITDRLVTEDFIVTGTIDTAEASLTARMSDAFEGASRSSATQVGDTIDAPEDMHPYYIEKIGEVFGRGNVLNLQEYVDYQLSDFGVLFSLLMSIVIPIVVFMMVLITILYLSVIILDEVPDIALLKCSGFGNGSIKAWQILRALIMLLMSTVLAVIIVNTAGLWLMRLLYRNMGVVVNYTPHRDILNYYILFPALLILGILAVVSIVIRKINSIELWRIRND